MPMTNREIENAALAFVIEQEAAEGREVHDTRGKGAAATLLARVA